MPLNLPRRRNTASDNGSDFISALRYRARDNTWWTWDDTLRETIEVSELQGTFDLANTRTGWARFAAGEPPDLVWDIGGSPQPRPSREHGRGFSVYLFLEGFGLRELCSNSAGMVEAISIVFDECEREPRAQQGLLPVIQPGEAVRVESPQFGVYYEPTFEI